MPDLSRLRWLLPILFPPAGLAAAIILGDLVATLLAAAAFVAAHLATIPDRTGRRLSLSPMVAVAALLLSDNPVLVVQGAALGMPVGWWLVRAVRGARSLDHLFPSEPLALAVSMGAYSITHALVEFVGWTAPDLRHAIAIGSTAVTWYATAAFVTAVTSGERRRTTPRLLWWHALGDGPAYIALFSGGAMFGFAWDAMSWWAFPAALLPYGFSHLSLNRVATTQRTYRQTMVALGRIPEASGLVGAGRAQRTGALAAEVAAEARLTPAEVQRVEYAGWLHDVGRVVFNDPAVAAGGYSDADVAAWGAAIIQESPYLVPVGQLVADQCKPYRRPGEARNDLLPRSAQVVRVCATYDRTLHEGGKTVVEALEDLHRGAAYDYDPEVVDALRRVLQRRGVAGA